MPCAKSDSVEALKAQFTVNFKQGAEQGLLVKYGRALKIASDFGNQYRYEKNLEVPLSGRGDGPATPANLQQSWSMTTVECTQYGIRKYPDSSSLKEPIMLELLKGRRSGIKRGKYRMVDTFGLVRLLPE